MFKFSGIIIILVIENGKQQRKKKLARYHSLTNVRGYLNFLFLKGTGNWQLPIFFFSFPGLQTTFVQQGTNY